MTPVRLRLKELRRAAGLSQTELGARAGVKQARISEIETGRVTRTGRAARIDVAMLGKLMDALDVEPSALIERVPAKKGRR